MEKSLVQSFSVFWSVQSFESGTNDVMPVNA